MNLLAKQFAHVLHKYADGFYEDEIRYGIEIVLGALLQIVIIMSVALLLGIGTPVLAIIASAMLYRRYSGGAHCEAYYRCTIASVINFILLGYLSLFIPLNYLLQYISGLVLFATLVIYYYVPVDNPIYRITDESIIKMKKKRSYGVLLLVILASLIIYYIVGEKLVSIALLLGLCWQNLTLLPWGQAYIHLWDRFFVKLEIIFPGEGVKKC